MAYVMPEVAIQRIIQYGINQLRSNRVLFDEVFAYLVEHPLMTASYGPNYLDKVWAWFSTEKIPVVQAFLLTPERIPCYSVHLSGESEDESAAGISDYYGDDDDGEIGINCFNITVDVGIHGSKVAEQVLWMYYILSDILFRNKKLAQQLGIEVQTYSASDWQRENQKNPENIYTRWVRMKLKVFNTWHQAPHEGPYDVDTEVDVSSIDSSKPIVDEW